jgi:hypothetical protein
MILNLGFLLDWNIKGIVQNIKKVINSLVGIDMYIPVRSKATYTKPFFTFNLWKLDGTPIL